MATRSGILDGQSYKPALWWIVLPVIVMSLLVFLVVKVIRKRRGDREEQVNANDLEQETENELELI
jgi:flagellar biosynthesis/type III secretory pathway M-ring protein FliF/YscJ